MRKKVLYLFLMFFFLFNIHIYSQERKNELQLGIGIWNLNEIINTASDIIISSIPNNAKMGNGNSFGSLHLAYKYRIRQRIGIGGLLAFDYATSEAILNGTKIGDFRKQHYTFAAEGDFIYLNFEKFKMYALAGLGATVYNLHYKDLDNLNQNESNSQTYFTFQITPIGIRYGERWGGFLEAGFGYRGILNAGIFFNL